MKKSTVITLLHLAYNLVIVVALTYTASLFHPEQTLRFHVIFATLIFIVNTWFYLTHRTPEGYLDLMSITGRKFW